MQNRTGLLLLSTFLPVWAGGERVVKSLGGSTTEYFYFGGLPIAELNGGTWSDYVFAGSKRIAVSTSAGSQNPAGIQAAASTNYVHGDQLGSARMMTTGTILTDPSTPWYATYAPFGQLVYGSLPSHYKFTGKERDDETALDYFGARYYASAEGRFLTPDWSATPEAVPYGHFENPQSLNLYAYVGNNPIADVDADGHWSWKTLLGLTISPEGGDQGAVVQNPGATNNAAGTQSPAADSPVPTAGTTVANIHKFGQFLTGLGAVGNAVQSVADGTKVSAAVQVVNVQVDSNGKPSATSNTALAVTATVNVNGASGDQKLLAQPQVGLSKLVAVSSDLVEEPNGSTHFQGGAVTVGLSTPTLPVTVTVPLPVNPQSTTRADPVIQTCGSCSIQ